MNQLVFVQDSKAVTDSLIVANSFKKEHSRVMRDIRELECSEEFRVGNFAESTYTNNQGREYPKFIMTEQGFTLLAMGYTGKDAMQFKEQYIQEFHKMRERLKNNVHVLDERQSLIQSMKLTIETAERQDQMQQVLETHQAKISQLETKVDEQITLDHGEQRRLQKAVAKRVYEITSEKDYQRQLFREIYREIKDRFAVASYKDVKRKELQQAIQYVEHFVPRKVS